MGDIKASPRNRLLGLLADATQGVNEFASKPFGYNNPPGAMLAGLFGLPGLSNTMNELSYGGALGTGSGMTWKPKADTVDAAMTLLPLGATAGKAAIDGGVALAKKAAPAIERAVPRVMERGGLSSQLLRDLSQNTVSPATVWHGSPHKFDKFDASKIGTGEGAQAYGHGLYLAEARDVGQDYANVLASPRNRVMDKQGVYIEPSPMGDGTYRLARQSEIGKMRGTVGDATQGLTDYQYPNIASAIKAAKKQGYLPMEGKPLLNAIGEDGKYVPVTKASDVTEEVFGHGPEYAQFIASEPGNLYKVDLPDEAIAKMLDWDKQLAEQPQSVIDALHKAGVVDFEKNIGPKASGEIGDLGWTSSVRSMPGETLYRRLTEGNFTPEMFASGQKKGMAQSVASDSLLNAGIPGIRYLDGGSRGTGAGTSNFVVFPGNEGLLTILERNGQKLNDAPGLLAPKFQYPQDKALATAQKNAALPVEQGGLGLRPDNTPMERAKALGFEDTYHGTKNPEPIKNLVPGGENGAATTGDAYGLGVYTSTDALGDASSYGSQGGVFPLMIDRSNHLRVDAPTATDLEKLSKFSGEQMLPSDKARFAIGRETRQFKDVQDARDFFANQRENWKQFGGGYDRAKPEAIANPDGTFAVQFTNFDAPVPITNGADVNTLLKATGWDNTSALGYSGHTLDRGDGRMWDITTDASKLRSRFAAFDPMRINENDLLGRASPGLLGILAGGTGAGVAGYNWLTDR